ncbi:hypothetical protein HII31_09274 [Pseudocercospora fuligena]|uniref:Uncharacterized protein n=1 Tax=Pseudocercospora fuligena TaxID=685502 RepID=A0A8H6RD60_9PEZI|nr:hypothetical protein HII31_09274 [Pseudocercospora fuligena]
MPAHAHMMADSNQIDQLLRQLDAQRDAYLAAFQKAHDLLAKDLASAAATSAASPVPRGSISAPRPLQRERRSPRQSFSQFDFPPRKPASNIDTLVASSGSRRTGDESDDDEDENLYVHQHLEHRIYEHEGLRDHLRSHKWKSGGGGKILRSILNTSRIQQPNLFPINLGKVLDRSHVTHCQVFDVGADGAPVPVELPEIERGPSNAIRIWNTIREVNRPSKTNQAVGRISIIREPSPILFGAVHYVHNGSFDMDLIYDKLVEAGHSSAHFHGAFNDDTRKQRSFVFNLEYFTVIGRDCQPMDWQMADRGNQQSEGSYHVHITRCSSAVALSLSGNPIKKVKNNSRRALNSHGYVYDPFAAWEVLNVQCYPDWKARTDVHDSTKHYVNGVEAFLVTLLGEFRDAQDRFESIYKEVTKLITPPLTFMFDRDVRDKLQFEDEHYTYSRRYFWAYQTLGIMNDSIRAIVDAFEDTFTEDVWEGKHRTLWPLLEENSQRSQYYKKKMAGLRKKFEIEMNNFRVLMKENHERRVEIRGLREELFTGTSIQESRSSVKNTEITIQQGHNIKLLTLVSMCFLPLTFVTSVFGMTNMSTEHHFWEFGIVTGTVCVPFFILIGSLNTTKGMQFWRAKTHAAITYIVSFCIWISTLGRRGNYHPDKANSKEVEQSSSRTSMNLDRAVTMDSAAAMRIRRWSSNQGAELANDCAILHEKQDEKDTGGIDKIRPVLDRASTSRIALMWSQERHRGSEV